MVKRCFRCGKEKPLDDFYRHSMMADGRLGKCKVCTRADVAANRAAKIEHYREYDRRRWREQPHRRELATRVGREYRKANPVRTKANRKVAYEVRAGRLRSKPCVVCGAERTVAHHDDYSAPLDVMWLCQLHHKARHAELDAAGHDYKDT